MTKKARTNSDWSAARPVLPATGPRRLALYRELRGQIEAGRLSPGDKLPTTRDIAARFGIARGAAVAAYEMLAADGFAEARVGAGTYVAAAVPSLQKEASPQLRNAPDAVAPLPGTLGCSTADATTLRIFRMLMNRHLTNPSPRHFHYNDPAGSHALRVEIAAYLKAARGVNCDPEQVIMTSGTQQALDLAIRALLKAGDPVWIEDPCYVMARKVFAASGMQVVPVPVDGEGLDVAAGARLAPQARAVYVTPSHQYPLGVTLSMARRLQLIDWAQRAGGYIIEDDYDSEFRFSGPPLSALQGIDGEGRVIYVGTFSKTLLPGFRIGYLVVPWTVRERVLEVRQLTDRFPSTLAEDALAEFLRDGHFSAHVKRARRRVRAARDALMTALEEAGLEDGGLHVMPPEQGLHLVAHLPAGIDDGALVEIAADAGFGVRALSPLYAGATDRRGLVIGFSGFEAEVLAQAARRFIRDPRFLALSGR
ncbi:transcriptional regulator, GntR family with aminotransferase domain-containing protein [Rhizobium sp. PDO1-076]|uniref:MocR-like pyridoxine biosynthesis transcription factor PdxR n=1 Tax=Rhizobium sp. PDO1-076 TaxID=1125979 RepID=UPI00024E2BCB|nr:PLP-dependent aminotransferase family protein [Rhizobium sp. PDO1-076]EHS49191.1 transcriptional regulator, GntR family with aminotransferase domain-containing protein [Rhizobium sp. PDO1-076]